jgi:4-amino-4-deoxy-L-arabinose transferase-like glycosyltransferase
MVTFKRRLRALTLTPLSGRSWWVFVLVASSAAVLVAAFVSSQLKAAEILPDFRAGYHPGAVSIQAGAGYVDHAGTFITAWPPGMSIVISPWVVEDVRESVRVLRFVSGCLTAVWVVLVALLSRLLLPRVSILIVLGIAVFWPPMWALGDPMGSEMLFTVFVTLAVYLLARLCRLRPPSLFEAAVVAIAGWTALAAATLTKTTGFAVAGAMLIGIVFGFHRWSVGRRIAVVLLGTLVFMAGLAPWVLKYREHTGHYGFTSNGLTSVRDGLRRYSNFPLGSELTKRSVQWQSYEDMWADVCEVSAADPMGALRLLGIKFIHPWYATWSRRLDRFLPVIQLPWFLLFVLASGRALWHWRQIPGEVILLHGGVAALWLSAASVAPIVRYLLPAFPFVVIVVFWHGLNSGLLGANARETQGLPGEVSLGYDTADRLY